MVGEGREGTDVGEERRDGGSAVVESGGQINAPYVDTHTHTRAGAAMCAGTLSIRVCATDQRSLEGYLQVSHKQCEGFSSPGAAAHLHLSFIWTHTCRCMHTHTQLCLSAFSGFLLYMRQMCFS